MSTEELIDTWKDEGSDDAPDGLPENPAGNQGLSEEELKLLESGLMGGAHTYMRLTCVVLC